MQKPTLTVEQIKTIVKLKLAGESTKAVARRMKCSPDQVTHYWRTSIAYKGIYTNHRRKIRATLASKASLAKANEVRQRLALERLKSEAKLNLAREIANAIADIKAGVSPPFKMGPLEW